MRHALKFPGRILAAMAAMIAMVAPVRAADLDHVSVRLDWLADAYHAPLFVAKERGYFAEQGLDVELGNGQGSISTLQVVGGGNGDIGLANLSALAMAASRGVPSLGATCMRKPGVALTSQIAPPISL